MREHVIVDGEFNKVDKENFKKGIFVWFVDLVVEVLNFSKDVIWFFQDLFLSFKMTDIHIDDEILAQLTYKLTRIEQNLVNRHVDMGSLDDLNVFIDNTDKVQFWQILTIFIHGDPLYINEYFFEGDIFISPDH